ncbi:MAG: hypothetical protein JW772_04440 [Candidatus Diapherotrites archaeon]|nr:hypothetical protein [Candidatus Diapherotrites archaeon]
MEKKVIPLVVVLFVILAGCPEPPDTGQNNDINSLIPNNTPDRNNDENGINANETPDNNKNTTDKNSGNITDEALLCLYFVHNNIGAPCLAEKEFLKEMQKKYPDLEVREIITGTAENNAKAYSLADIYGIELNFVPVTFIGDNAVVGFSESLEIEIEEKIKNCAECKCKKI